jgi:16S rRNA G966 N2-methylase RsmD
MNAEASQKLLGQYFTAETIAALTCAATIGNTDYSVIDPMAGNGNMLLAAIARLNYLKKEGEVTGIEIDPVQAVDARNRIDSHIGTTTHSRIIVADAFQALGGELKDQHQSFDTIVGNPPYIRYQNVAHSILGANQEIALKLRQLLPMASDSELSNQLIRLSLVLHLVQANDQGQRLKMGLMLLKSNSMNIDQSDRAWVELVRGYSGLADISLPSWLMTWLLLKPGGLVGYVTTSSWRHRDYAAAQRYFMYRFMKPIHIIEQDNNWFGDASIPTSLIILKARDKSDFEIPVHDRSITEHYLHTRIKGGVSLLDPVSFTSIGDTLHQGSNRGDIAAAAAQIYSAIRTEGKSSWYETELVQVNELMSDMTNGSKLILKIENSNKHGSVSRKIQPSRHQLPRLVADLFKHPIEDEMHTLEELGISINQGLRTGCNDFFYMQQHSEATNGDHVQVDLSKAYGGKRGIFPSEFLVEVVRYQKELKGWTTNEPLRHRLLLTKDYYSPHDLEVYAKQMTLNGERAAGEEGAPRAAPLPESLAKYIDEGALKHLVSGESKILWPELSAVKPNQRIKNSHDVSWWHTLHLKERHYGDVIMPRINGGEVKAYENAVSQKVIDANFSTLSVNASSVTPYALLAILNSLWVRTLLETIASPMGGGALKVEATHLRKLILPLISVKSMKALERYGEKMAKDNIYLGKIDDVILESLAKSQQIQVGELKLALESVKSAALSARTRNHSTIE